MTFGILDGYTVDRNGLDFAIGFLIGLGLRALAFVLLGTDRERAEKLFSALRMNQDKNTRVFWDSVELKLGTNFKDAFLEALRGSRVCLPIISTAFLTKLESSLVDGVEDNVLLEWDSMLEHCDKGSGQIIIPVFFQDGTTTLDFRKAAAAMKDVKALGCNRSAKEIWEAFKASQGRHIDISDPHQVQVFAYDVQKRLTEPLHARRIVTFNLYEKDDPAIFIECDDVLKEIDEIFKHGRICNITGLGGSGKTFVANKYAFLMFRRGYIIGKLTADSEGNIIKDYDAYLQTILGVDKIPVRTGKLAEYVQYASQSIRAKQFIILDNVKDAADVEDFIMSTNENVIYLITSRTFIANPVVRKQFYPDEACVEYLKKETNARFNQGDYQKIVDMTNGFPLRLNVSAKYLQNPFASVDLYISEIRSRIEKSNFVVGKAENASDAVDELYPEISFAIDNVSKMASFNYSYLLLMAQLEPDLIIEKFLFRSFEQYQLQQQQHEANCQKKLLEMESNASNLFSKSKPSPPTSTPFDLTPKYRFKLTSDELKLARSHALITGLVEIVYSSTNPHDNTLTDVSTKIHRCVQAEIRDRIKKESLIQAAVSEIASLYDKETKSYETLYAEIKEGNIEDVQILLQKWTICIVDARKLEVSGLDTLAKALSKNTAVKNLEIEWLR
ncbi:hypothetical protein HK098_001115, partial [Nowakowskiella sp. JEL0407]